MPRPITTPQRETTAHLATFEPRAHRSPSDEQIDLCEARKKIDAIHERKAERQALAEVWDD